MKNTNIVLETVPNISVSEGTSYKQAYMYKVGEAWSWNVIKNLVDCTFLFMRIQLFKSFNMWILL